MVVFQSYVVQKVSSLLFAYIGRAVIVSIYIVGVLFVLYLCIKVIKSFIKV